MVKGMNAGTLEVIWSSLNSEKGPGCYMFSEWWRWTRTQVSFSLLFLFYDFLLIHGSSILITDN